LNERDNFFYPQDLHIHTTFSNLDSSVVPEQTPELVARVRHAQVVGISDHFEHFADGAYDAYVERIGGLGLLIGTEVDGADSVDFAAKLDFRYYIYHCRDREADYVGAERLLATGHPVIIAHPHALGTNLDRVSEACLVEINNRYIWRCDWNAYYGPHVDRFRYVISSDAHQPNWLSQSVARRAAAELGIRETNICDLLTTE
jgi:hypothetical protein